MTTMHGLWAYADDHARDVVQARVREAEQKRRIDEAIANRSKLAGDHRERSTWFERATRALSGVSTRRALLGRSAVTGLATLLAHLSVETEASQAAGELAADRKRRRKKALQRNEFGCVNVGGKCRGKDANCCSGICQGKKPKKGEKDGSRCVAHNAGSCTPERNICVVGDNIDAACNLPDAFAVCFATTGNAGFCGSLAAFNPDLNCRACNTDADCEAFGFTVGTACVVLEDAGACGNQCAATDKRACIPPAI
jgi:hypothetical protein